MQKFNMLVLTDHTNHSAENAIYPFALAMSQHPRCRQLDVATRGLPLNDYFFKERKSKSLFVTKVTTGFTYSPDGEAYKKDLKRQSLRHYDVVWLRLPPPLSKDFLDFLPEAFPHRPIINDPKGIYETGSKAFLLNFPKWCPPMKLCTSLADIEVFKSRFPIVLKPLREYGGRGLVRIDGDRVWEGSEETTWSAFAQKLGAAPFEYLGVKFLKNVAQGDKRIVVVNGEIMGASLRLPPKGNWICNVAQGGRAVLSEPDETEIQMVEDINPRLRSLGILMYGVDTLVGDDGKRVLSELNTTSIGGLPQIAQQTGRPLLKKAVDHFWNYITEKILNDDHE
ncbi:MAG: glutathione synthetase [Bacteroidetes bacterium]|nr:MAG: glutathione synthetase [Bacteroidota bacterium]